MVQPNYATGDLAIQALSADEIALINETARQAVGGLALGTEYADPGYQPDGKQRYPIDSETHVRAAWSYINMPKNAQKYSSEQVSNIKAKIKAAGKKYDIEFSDDSNACIWHSDNQATAAEGDGDIKDARTIKKMVLALLKSEVDEAVAGENESCDIENLTLALRGIEQFIASESYEIFMQTVEASSTEAANTFKCPSCGTKIALKRAMKYSAVTAEEQNMDLSTEQLEAIADKVVAKLNKTAEALAAKDETPAIVASEGVTLTGEPMISVAAAEAIVKAAVEAAARVIMAAKDGVLDTSTRTDPSPSRRDSDDKGGFELPSDENGDTVALPNEGETDLTTYKDGLGKAELDAEAGKVPPQFLKKDDKDADAPPAKAEKDPETPETEGSQADKSNVPDELGGGKNAAPAMSEKIQGDNRTVMADKTAAPPAQTPDDGDGDEDASASLDMAHLDLNNPVHKAAWMASVLGQVTGNSTKANLERSTASRLPNVAGALLGVAQASRIPQGQVAVEGEGAAPQTTDLSRLFARR